MEAAQAGKTQLMELNSQLLPEPLAETLQKPQPQPAVLQSSPVVTHNMVIIRLARRAYEAVNALCYGQDDI